jgi:hypothetical protein
MIPTVASRSKSSVILSRSEKVSEVSIRRTRNPTNRSLVAQWVEDIQELRITLFVSPDQVDPFVQGLANNITLQSLAEYEQSYLARCSLLTLRFIVTNNSGSCFAQGGSFTS